MATPNGVDGRLGKLKIALGNLTKNNQQQLVKLSEACFPVRYQPSVYQDLVAAPEYTRLGYFQDVLVSAVCCRVENDPQKGKRLYVMLIGVLKTYRRRGIASQLMEWALCSSTRTTRSPPATSTCRSATRRRSRSTRATASRSSARRKTTTATSTRRTPRCSLCPRNGAPS